MTTLRLLAAALVATLSAALTACGGGGSDAPPPTPPAATAPAITAQPQSVTVMDGQGASFSVTASGTAPLTYQWRRNGSDIAGATGNAYAVAAATLADSGASFSVQVSNSAGPVTSNAATLTVNPVAPSIATQPASISVSEGQTATFVVAANGSATLAYQWRRNGADIADATAASYTTAATVMADSGAVYTVIVGNGGGTVTSGAAILTVTATPTAPTITTSPANAAVSIGQTATFTVVAAGTAPFTYQWRRDGVDIPGATAAGYTTGAAALVDNGTRFSVVVTNGVGSAASNEAVLSVTTASFTGVIQDGSLDGTNTGFDSASSIVIDANGNMYIAGSCIGTIADADPTDTGWLCVVKYSASGVRLWSTQFGAGNVNSLTAIALDGNGNVYAAGRGRITGLPYAGLTDAFVVKFDPNGVKQWARQFGSDRDEALWGMAVDRQANVVVVGSTNGSLPGNTNLGSFYDAFVAKFDTNGNQLWINQFGPSIVSDDARAVVTDAAGNIFVAGEAPEIVNGSLYGGPISGFVAKFNPAGVRQFLTPLRIDADKGLRMRAITLDEGLGVLYVAAEAITVGRGTVIAALDLTGQVRWLTRVVALPVGGVGTADAMPQSIALGNAGGGVFVTGWTNGVMPGQGSAGREDIFVLRCEVADGALTWVRQIGSTPQGVSTDDLDDAGNGIAVNANGDVLVAGVVRGVLGTPRQIPHNRGIEDWFIARFRPADGVLY